MLNENEALHKVEGFELTGYLHSLDYPFAFYLTITTDVEGVDMALRDRQLYAGADINTLFYVNQLASTFN